MVPLDVSVQVVSYYILTNTSKPWMVWGRDIDNNDTLDGKGCIEVGEITYLIAYLRDSTMRMKKGRQRWEHYTLT